eukprot:TRINITY_DN15129_c1_g1_i1.p1 TRINITY_DN15129_c1_g1~~TRINITY_DN15129_c1_g1_i1.p1  ORF type:complete len:205 (+),score=58.15 TRINITY_DN15129_c1_g1_i1:84-617(+)
MRKEALAGLAAAGAAIAYAAWRYGCSGSEKEIARAFPVGSTVELVGLVKNPRHNKKRVQVVGYRRAHKKSDARGSPTGEWLLMVRLDDEDKPVLPVNCVLWDPRREAQQQGLPPYARPIGESLESHIAKLEERKKQAVATEDYQVAQELKIELDTCRRELAGAAGLASPIYSPRVIK